MSVVERSLSPRPRVWRALLWKEWRGLRHLRWACAGLGALLPLFFIGGAEAGRQGYSPFGRGGSYALATIFTDAVPGALAFAVWPLAALLLVAQAFAGERPSGTESFLLERPVSRDRIWSVRLLACFASLVVVMALTTGVWAGCFVMSGAAASHGWSEPLQMLGVGVGIGAAVAACGVLSSTLLPSPLLAILAAALCAALPALLSIALGNQFPYARWGGVSIGVVTPWLLIPLYLFVSFFTACRGEPAGRGRASRGVLGFVISLIVVAFVFVASAQAALRRDSVRPNADGGIQPGPSGDRMLIGNAEVWLVDTRSARVLEHYPMPSFGRIWRSDGAMFAIATMSGPLGSEGRPRVSFFDAQGTPVATPYFSKAPEAYFRLAWSGSRLVIIEEETVELNHIILFEPGKGEIGRMDMRLPINGWDYAGRLWDGSDAITQILPGSSAPARVEGWRVLVTSDDLESRRSAYGLYRADLSKGRIDSTPLVEERGAPFGARFRLSPDGRWWLRDRPKGAPQEMLELASGRAVPTVRGGWPDDPARFYLSAEGDGAKLIQEGPDRVPKTIRSWTHADLSLTPSPSKEILLLQSLSTRDRTGESSTILEDYLYDVGSGSWTELGPPSIPGRALPGAVSGWHELQRRWAGPRCLARTGPGLLAFEDVDAIGKLRYVVGGP